MESNRRDTLPGPARWVSIERWAVERLDREAGLARIEWVPMRPEFISDELATMLIDTGVQVGMDQLSRWDLGRAEIRKMSIRRVVAELGLRRDEGDALSENMVFWVLRGVEKEPHRVVHATRAAREVARDLYREVVRREEGRHERQ